MGCLQSKPAPAPFATLSGALAAAARGAKGERLATADVHAAVEAHSRPDDVEASRRAAREAEEAAEALFRANAGRKFRDKYVRATLVSYGANCKVFSAADKDSGEPVAIKTIRKVAPPTASGAGAGSGDGGGGAAAAAASGAAAARQRARVLREVGAALLLNGHPHAARLLDAYEDGRAYHLVTEYLAGGELFDHIGAAGALTEAQAAAILRSLCLFLAHAHSRGVAHMDVKPENIMFDAEGSQGVLKVIDLGSAEFLQEGQLAARAFGTVRYCSPEMARDVCGRASDVWSAGVVMYQILAGRVPFLRDTDAATLALLQRGPRVKFAGAKWRRISPAAKDCIRAMLHPDHRQRPTASQVLQHPWLTAAAAAAPGSGGGGGGAEGGSTIDASTLHQLQLFASLNRARRLMFGVAAKTLSGAEASQLLSRFLALDRDFSGTVDLKELGEAARQVAPDMPEAELRALFAALDVDGTGAVDAHEFAAALLAGGLEPEGRASEAVAARSFRALDRGANGFITRQDLTRALSLQRPAAFEGGDARRIEGELDAEFAAMDLNGDGVVSYDEFKTAIAGIARTLSLGRSSLSLSEQAGGSAGGGGVAGASDSGSLAGGGVGGASPLGRSPLGQSPRGGGAGGGGFSGGGRGSPTPLLAPPEPSSPQQQQQQQQQQRQKAARPISPFANAAADAPP